jgi:RNA polymerase sigma-70 factor (ECF subfamily)
MKEPDDVMDDDLRKVSLCKKGDLDAFEELVIKYQKKMLNISFRMIGNYEEACEVVQDAFVSAYKHITDFEGRSGFSTWLCSIVINLSRNRLKQLKAALGRELFSIDDPVATESGFMRIEPASQAPTALEQLEKKQLQEKVEDCISRLDADFRAVLVLRDIQGFSYEEVSGVLNINPGTVKSRLFRARDSMRDCLKKSLGRL